MSVIQGKTTKLLMRKPNKYTTIMAGDKIWERTNAYAYVLVSD